MLNAGLGISRSILSAVLRIAEIYFVKIYFLFFGRFFFTFFEDIVEKFVFDLV